MTVQKIIWFCIVFIHMHELRHQNVSVGYSSSNNYSVFCVVKTEKENKNIQQTTMQVFIIIIPLYYGYVHNLIK